MGNVTAEISTGRKLAAMIYLCTLYGGSTRMCIKFQKVVHTIRHEAIILAASKVFKIIFVYNVAKKLTS